MRARPWSRVWSQRRKVLCFSHLEMRKAGEKIAETGNLVLARALAILAMIAIAIGITIAISRGPN